MTDSRFESLQPTLTRIIGVFIICFSAAFLIAERDGLLRLAQWIGNGVANVPAAISYILNYYATHPRPDALLLPSGLGVGVGLGVGLYVIRRARVNSAIAMQGMVFGGIGGAAGSQVLVYATRHCTFQSTSPIETGIGWGLAGIGALMVVLPLWTWRLRGNARVGSNAGYFRGVGLPYLLLTPTLIGLALFLYYPSLQTLLISLNARRAGLPQERFVCLTNYINLANDPIYSNSFFTSLVLTAGIVLGSMAAALGIALLASQKIRGAGLYRTLIIFPFALSPVVTATIFLAMFRSGGSGLINALLGVFGAEPLNWVNDVNLSRIVVILAAIWNILGFNTLFYISGLQNVPKELLEAAAMDGANRPTRFWRVTFPLLAPYSFFLLITNVTYAFYGIYGAVDTLTSGGPPLGAAGSLGGATNVLIYKLYADAFGTGSSFGSAAAQAVILFLFVAFLTLLQFRTLERQITYGG